MTITLSHVLAVAGLFLTVISSVIGFFTALVVWFIRKNESQQDAAILDLQKFASWAREELAKYEVNVGAGTTAIDGVHSELRSHVTREEQIFWKKVDAIAEAQRIFAEAVLQRISSIEARMPNGELKEMAVAMAKLVADMEATKQIAITASRHVEEHNAESEDWKRRIVAIEALVERRKNRVS